MFNNLNYYNNKNKHGNQERKESFSKDRIEKNIKINRIESNDKLS